VRSQSPISDTAPSVSSDPEGSGLEDPPTKASDCYALGTVIYEVFVGRARFPRRSETTAPSKVMRDERPRRPQGDEGKLFTDEIWEVVEHCWKRRPGDRLSAEGVLRRLEGHSSSLRAPGDRKGRLFARRFIEVLGFSRTR
jgi:hypothetical protein